MNKVFMVGRLAQDPQQFVTQNGITQSRISVASSDNWNKNETYFFPCVAWQSTANFINAYLHKGDLVAIDGKLIRRSYVSKEGKTVYVIEVVIESIKPLYTKNNDTNIPSSLDKNYKSNFTKSNDNQSAVKTEEDVLKQFEDMEFSNNKPNNSSSFNDDPFAMSEDDSDSVVNLDWLDEFKD
ncbi:MAG: single-stranded DNA-binding protein [Malacoplasma sp.]|nr:single-stranded DNA-binding protein [Malacoplasma sp.]MDE6429381.1 single-stranded DNA-binding protein [Malacoplasma sp.]